MVSMTESILLTIKKVLGLSTDLDSFDFDLIVHINSVFMILNQLGIGPAEPFSVVDNTTSWNDFIGEGTMLALVKSYMYLKVKLLFDPPTISYLIDSANRQIEEFEQRLVIQNEFMTGTVV
jgi:hypothetical protein